MIIDRNKPDYQIIAINCFFFKDPASARVYRKILLFQNIYFLKDAQVVGLLCQLIM